MRDVNSSITVESWKGGSAASESSGAALLAVAAEPVRWRLLSALSTGTRCVCTLQPVAGVSAPALSHHLKALRAAGLVTAARRGKWIDYTLSPDAFDRLSAALPLRAGHPATESGIGAGGGRR